MGLLVALQHFIQIQVEAEKQQQLLGGLQERLLPALQAQAQLVLETGTGETKLHLNVGEGSRDAAFKVLLDLQSGSPYIHPDPGKLDQGVLIFSASCLKPEHPEQIAERLNSLLSR